MPKKFDDMVSSIKAQVKKDNPKMSDKDIDKKAYAIATAQWKKSHGGKAPGKEKLTDWRLLEFYVPIEESLQEENDFVIRGVAINETTTLNNVKYVAEELVKAAPTFRNVPILLDHKNEVKNIVGRTTENVNWNPQFSRIEYEAKIMDNDIKEMIKDGRIGSVSIGAKVEDLTEEEDGSMKAIGIRGLEISLVAVPGDSHANIAQAIQHSFKLKEMAMQEEANDELNLEDSEMSEEEQKTSVETPEETSEESKEETSEESTEEPKEEPSEEKSEEATENLELKEIKTQIAELKELLKTKKKLQEQVEDEKEEKEQMEDKTKGEVSSETEEALEKVNSSIIEAMGRGTYALYKDYSKESADTSLKRLVR